MKGKKLLSILMAMSLLSALAGCAPKTPSTTGTTGDGKIDTSKFVELNFVALGNKPTNGQLEKVRDEWNKYLKEKINASLDIKWVEWADYTTKYNLLLASGEPLDLINTASDWLDLFPNAQKGAFKELDDLLPKYAPQTWANVTKENWEQTKLNGKIVTIPEDQYSQWVNHGFMYRGDWAKQFGITEPIKDWEGMGKYFQGIKDNKKGVIPWDLAGGGFSAFFGWVNAYTPEIGIDPIPLPCNGGAIVYGKSIDDPYTAVSPIFEDTFMNYAKTMKQWGDAGYWREDVLNYKGDGVATMKAGQSGTRQHHTQTYVGFYNELEKNQPGSDLQYYSFSDTSNNLVKIAITHGGTSVGANSKNPERALMAYDLIRNDEKMYKLFNYGLEGVQYEVKDGKRVEPAGYNADRDGFYTDFWGGRNDKFEIPSATIYPKYQDLYKKLEAVAKPYPYGRFTFDKSPIENEIAAIGDVVNKNLPAISWGKAGDPEKAVNDFREQLKQAGFDKYMAEIQKQLDAYKKLVEGK